MSTSFNLYSTSRWKRVRAYQLTTEPLCRMCAQLGRRVPASVADHIEPHRQDVTAFWNNELQSLCKTCHDSHKQAQEKGGYLRGCDINGRPLDRSHPWTMGKGGRMLEAAPLLTGGDHSLS